jgi:hypothetical protein
MLKRSKHWFAVASLWLLAVAVVLAPEGWRWG